MGQGTGWYRTPTCRRNSAPPASCAITWHHRITSHHTTLTSVTVTRARFVAKPWEAHQTVVYRLELRRAARSCRPFLRAGRSSPLLQPRAAPSCTEPQPAPACPRQAFGSALGRNDEERTSETGSTACRERKESCSRLIFAQVTVIEAIDVGRTALAVLSAVRAL